MRTSRTLGIVLSAAIIALLTLSATAYKTQKGYVKTRGRQPVNEPYKKGRYLSNVVIEILDGTAPRSTRSIKDGSFSFTLSGNSFSITKVSAQKYVLSDYDILGKVRRYSENPFEITVDLPSSTVEDFKNNQTNMMAKLRKEVEQLRKKYDNLLKHNKITEKEYYKLQEQLIDYEQKNGKFILDLAEKYSKLDFDKIDEDQRKFIAFIQNGEYEKADSLLKTQKSIDEWEKELSSTDSNIKTIHEEIDRLRETEKEGLRNREIALEQIDKLCSNNFNLCALRLQNDSAAYWLERRANDDTTNIDWQLEAGSYISEYLADYDKAMRYNQTALERAKEINDLEKEALALYNIGMVCLYKRNPKALEYHEKALKIRLDVFDENHPGVAISYNGIGLVYSSMGNYPKALEYHEKALKSWLSCFGENHPGVATSYDLIGLMYLNMGNNSKAMECHEKALKIRLDVFDGKHPDIAKSYDCIGLVYRSMGNYSKALESHEKALKIRLVVLDGKHPEMANSYDYIGLVYHSMGNNSKALECHEKALKIRLDILDENHPSVATSYNNIGLAYLHMRNYPNALEYYEKALRIFLGVLGENHADVANSYNNIGFVYSCQEDFDKALEYHLKALKICQIIFDEQHPNVATCHNIIGTAYYNQGDNSTALEHFEKALKIEQEILGENHPVVASSYKKIGETYESMRDYHNAFDNFEKSLQIKIEVFGENHPEVFDSYEDIGISYCALKRYSNGLKYLEKALSLSTKIYGEDDPTTIDLKNYIEKLKTQMSEEDDE